MSIYTNDFLLVSNKIDTLKALKHFFSKEYDTKDLGEVKIIIRWQIN